MVNIVVTGGHRLQWWLLLLTPLFSPVPGSARLRPHHQGQPDASTTTSEASPPSAASSSSGPRSPATSDRPLLLRAVGSPGCPGGRARTVHPQRPARPAAAGRRGSGRLPGRLHGTFCAEPGSDLQAEAARPGRGDGGLRGAPADRDRRQRPSASLRAISVVRDTAVDLGAAGPVLGVVLFLLWANLLVAGASNGVNVTDGLDGLATGASVMVFGAYTGIGLVMQPGLLSAAGAHSTTCATRSTSAWSPAPSGVPASASVVERLARQHHHGRHGIALPRRGAGGSGHPDPHRGAAHPARESSL